ncbi:MAG: flagellar biosynthesis protein FlhA [Candidatus Jordarchaeum sp.]|uniref:flagellar biosynthesis protein FlhA n=1 Tax=Candidatus Jordarchaeum sp. TaxID=2823881 RepID=UPI00404A389E
MKQSTSLQSNYLKFQQSDIQMAVAVIAIMLVMVIPLPTFLLDGLLSFSFIVALIILLTSLYIKNPLEFSTFPSLLLLTTLFRLSLNIASTRLILLYGNEGVSAAGHVIKSFGQFVIGGNYVVGFIVFIILVIINFVVITRGSGRIAEVAARFTLDAMPGKQMSIDADLNAGIIDEKEARKRRELIAREADFYGAMDGASKFVRGEAIAGLLIILINIIGGFVIGIIQHRMDISLAAQTYTVLSIGDALVAQIPALMISTASGIIVSRAAAENSMGRELNKQFKVQPHALILSASILFCLGLLPGLPHIPFITLSLLFLILGYLALREQKSITQKVIKEEHKVSSPPSPEQLESLLTMDRLELEVGYGLIPIVDEEQNGELLERIRAIRRQFAAELGIIVPPLRVRDNLQLKPGDYRILIKGNEVAKGEMMIGYIMALNPGDVKKDLEGIPTKEPVFGMPAIWILEKQKDEALFSGYTVVDIPTIMATHLVEVIRTHADELLSRQDVQKLLDRLSQHYPKAVEELTPHLLSLGVIQKVLQNLLKEKVSIRDLLTIVETLADYATITKDPEVLTEYVRQRLARSIINQYITPDGVLPVISLDQGVEDILREKVQKGEYGIALALEPNFIHRLITNLNQVLERCLHLNYRPILLCSPVIRRHVKRLIERFFPNLVVISHSELIPQIKIQSLGTVTTGGNV